MKTIQVYFDIKPVCDGRNALVGIYINKDIPKKTPYIFNIGKDGIFNIKIPDNIDYIMDKYNKGKGIIFCAEKNIFIRLILNEHCKEIHSKTFFKDTHVKELVCNKELRLIGEMAFSNANIENIILPENSDLTYLNNNCFSYSNLESIIIPQNLKTIGDGAFLNSKLQSVDFSKSKNLRKIAKDAFASTKLKTVCFPNCLRKIGSYAFEFCENLTSVIFPENSNICQISEFAFKDCRKLNYFHLNYINKSILKLGNGVFYLCNNLKTIDGFSTWNIVKIPDGCFAFCDMSELFTIPNTVRYIGNYAFDSSNAINLKLHSHVVSVGDYCFSCVVFNIKNFNEFLDCFSIQSIGKKAFSDCKFKEIDTSFFLKLNNLGSYAFSNNDFENLEIYPLAQNIKAKFIFSFNTKLKTVIFKSIYKQETTIRSAMFYMCSNLKEVILSPSITTIKKDAFLNCGEIEKIILSKNLEVIEKRAFKNTKITNIDLSSTKVVNFPFEVFSEITLNEDIKLNIYTRIVNKKAFNNLKAFQLLKYPFACIV